MVPIIWASTARPVPPAAVAEPVEVPDLESLFAQWQRASDKGAFISALPAETAGALTSLICERVPKASERRPC